MENIAVGISTTIVGMLIVFAVLCLLAVILSMFKHIAGDKPAAPVISAPASLPPVNTEPEAASQTAAEDGDAGELVAVLAAAVAASLNTQADKLIVRSFRKVSNWNETAKRESMKDNSSL